MKIYFFLITSILSILVFAEDQNVNIFAKKARIENDRFLLEEEIEITFSFGKVKAKNASAHNWQNSDQNKQIEFFDDVTISLLSGAMLNCDEAFIDLERQKLTFSSQNKRVTYRESLQDGQKKPLVILAKTIICQLEKSANFENIHLQNIDKITFLDDVEMIYDNTYRFLSHKAYYEQIPNVSKKNPSDFSGFFTLYPKDDTHPCLFEAEEDQIFSSLAKIDLGKNDFYLEKPHGKIKTTFLNSNEFIHFSADQLFWQDYDLHLTLKNNVELTQEDSGFLQSDELEVFQRRFHSTRSLQRMRLKGPSKICFNKNNATLNCPGQIELDHINKIIVANDHFSGNTREKILFCDGQTSLFGNRAFMKYENDPFILQEVLLEDDVRFKHNLPNQVCGYGIAEKIIYIPKIKKMELFSNKEQNVLFWQDDGSLSLSAPKVLIDRKKDQKDFIQGIGDVRFSFNVDEAEMFQNIFTQYIGKK